MPFGDYRFDGDARPEAAPEPSEAEKWARCLSEWHGISEYYRIAKQDVVDNGVLSYWDIEMALSSPETVIERIIRGVDTASIISGLFLSATIPLLIESPDTIASLPEDDSWRSVFTATLCGSVIVHVLVISFGFMFVYALTACQREVDWMFFLRKYGWMTSTIYGLHAVGNLLLAVATGAAMTQAYSETAGVIFLIASFILCGVIPLACGKPFMRAAGGVRRNKTDESRLSVFLLENYLRPLAEDEEKHAMKAVQGMMDTLARTSPELKHLCLGEVPVKS